MTISLEARSSVTRPPLAAAIRDRLVRRLLSFTGTQKFLTAQLDITNACNLACAHCYHAHHSNAGALDLDGWNAVLDQYAALARKLYLAPNFILCGGEPTVSPIFLPMLRELDSRWPGVGVTVLTNGSRLTRQFVESLRGYNLDFQISLDGPDAARHDRIRGAGSFAQVLAGLANLQARGRNASFLATLSRQSATWIPEFFETALNVGALQMKFTRFVPEGYGRLLQEAHVDRPLSPAELRDAYREILACSERTGMPTNGDLPLMHLVDPRRGANGKSGFQGLVIDYQGNLKVSSRVGFTLGNVLKDGLENLFLRHPIMEAFRDRRIEGCGTCVHYEHCGGDRNASFVATGSFLKKDPGCWLEAAPEA